MSSLRQIINDILIKDKLLTQEQLEQALKIQKDSGGSLSDILVKQNIVKQNELMLALSEGLGLPPIDLKRFKIDTVVAKLIPKDVAVHYHIIPISRVGGTLTVAMADPLNIFAIDDVKSLTGYDINPIISPAQDIQSAIDNIFSVEAGDVVSEIVKGMEDVNIEVLREERQELSAQELSRMTSEAPVIKVTNLILEEAVRMGASDILIEPLEYEMQIRFRVDGVLQKYKSPPRLMHASIISRIKVIANLNIAEHRLPQDGRFKAKIFSREVDFRVSILPSSFGEKAALRVLDKGSVQFSLDKLGFDSQSLEVIEKVSSRPHGMILVCGPTGSGKTTTLYSILKFVDSPDENLVTVEDPVEYQLPGINQVSIRPEIGLTFAACLRSILRQDPDVIMIGEIRDFETVDIAIKSALTGHLVLSTLHTTSAAGAIIRLVNMGVEPFLLTASLNCIVSQRLVRVICPSCKEKYDLPEPVSAKLGMDPKLIKSKKHEFSRGKGCKSCFNSGYRGRINIAEIMPLSFGLKELIMKKAKETAIKTFARKEGMRTLRESGLALALRGVTTVEEILRVTAPDEPLT